MCDGGEICIGGLCTEQPDNMCDPRNLPDAFCSDCALQNCCEQMEDCVGDRDVEPYPVCNDLASCIDVAVQGGRPECIPAMGVPVDWAECITAACPDFVEGINEWLPLRSCLDEACAISCP